MTDPPSDTPPPAVLPDDYFSRPHTARIWNYWMGGDDNYPVDRRAGDEVASEYPEIFDMARQGREFQLRVVRFLAGEQGIDQVLDIGTGYPMGHLQYQNTHEIVHSLHPEGRVLYVDNDPVVLAHARARLTAWRRTGVVDYADHDVHDPDGILERARAVLDLDRPVAVLFLGVLGHVVDFAEARSIVARVMAAVPADSYLAVRDGVDSNPTFQAAMARFGAAGAAAYHPRSAGLLRRYFDGLELVEPGLVPCSMWRPPPAEVGAPRSVMSHGGVARKP